MAADAADTTRADNLLAAFPSDWPPCCPPADAAPASGVYFRICKSKPPALLDFETHFESGKMPKASPCLRAGLSTMRSEEDAAHQIDLFPFLGSHIAAGRLKAEHGQSQLTPGKVPSHTTWWPYQDVDRVAPFRVVRSVA